MLRERVNQKLIAKRLRLSPATVSKSFRNHPDIRPETRAKVLAYAAQLGYSLDNIPAVANGNFHVHKLPDTRFVAAIIHDNHGPEFADVSGQSYVLGLSQAASRRNISLILHRFRGESEQILDAAHQPPAMRQNSLEGLVLIHRFEDDVVRQLANQVPCITLTFYVPGAACDHIDSNHTGAMTNIVHRLYNLGHRKFGYIGHPNRPSSSLARFGAFAQALARLGLSLDTSCVANVFNEVMREWDHQAEMVSRKIQQGVTAWVCSVDTVGYNLCRRLMERGIRVPQDVSITGYDVDEPMFGLPQLTSVRVPFVEMGDYALDKLLERIDRPSMPLTQTLFDCKIVEGQTMGPAPSNPSGK